MFRLIRPTLGRNTLVRVNGVFMRQACNTGKQSVKKNGRKPPPRKNSATGRQTSWRTGARRSARRIARRNFCVAMSSFASRARAGLGYAYFSGANAALKMHCATKSTCTLTPLGLSINLGCVRFGLLLATRLDRCRARDRSTEAACCAQCPARPAWWCRRHRYGSYDHGSRCGRHACDKDARAADPPRGPCSTKRRL